MKKYLLVLIIVVALFSLMACYTHTHVVGRGAQAGVTTTQSQWYALFGLVPINNVDTKAMAGGAEDYTITTEQTFLDGFISGFTWWLTISKQTVKIER